MREAAHFTKIATERQLSKGKRVSKMTPEERDEMNRICKLIQEEKDHQRFSLLIAKLVELIGRKERRLEEQDSKSE
jgi:hypothetical protein